jgi:hypothetical protein
MSDVIAVVECADKKFGTHEYSVTVLSEFGRLTPSMTPQVGLEMWREYSKHPVLFSDYTEGKPDIFLSLLLDPRAVWLEFRRLSDSQVVGAGYLTNVITNFDAESHFVFWDAVGRGREPLVWEAMRWVFERYNLHRLTALVPPYQSGVIRFIHRLGFKREGEKREAVIYKSHWHSLIEFGILRKELANIMEGVSDG